jgi:hypothetical protein
LNRNPSTISGWRNGKGIPLEIGPVEDAFFGDSPSFDDRAALRAAHTRSLGPTQRVRFDPRLLQAAMDTANADGRLLVRLTRVQWTALRAARAGAPISKAMAERISGALGLPLASLLGPAGAYLNKAESPPPVEALPRPEALALQFAGDVDGPIDLSPASNPGEHLNNESGQREDYAELRAKAVELGALGSNRLGRVHLPITRFLELSDNFAAVRLKLFWSRINTLRIVWQDHERATARGIGDGELNEHKLEATVASHLKDLVETINIFVVGDPGLMELDSIRPGPQEIDAAKIEIGILAPVLDDVIAGSHVASEAARNAMTEQVSNVETSGETVAGRQANAFGRRSIRNFMGELLRRAYVPVRAALQATRVETGVAWKGVREGAYRLVGAAFITGVATDLVGKTNFTGIFVEFVMRHSEALSAYVSQAFQNPMLVEIIKWIVRSGS